MLTLRVKRHNFAVLVPRENYRVVQKSEASAYFCLCLLNALTKCNKFGILKQQFKSNTVVHNFYLDIH